MTNIIRLFVLALTVSGAAAFTHVSTSGATSIASKAMPRPNCAPSDPNGCGMAGFSK